MYRILNDLRAPIDRSEEDVLAEAKKILSLPNDTEAFIYRKSLDRRKDRFSFVYSVAVNTERTDERLRPFPSYTFPSETCPPRTVPIVGFGPAGMFCAWLLAKCGARPLVIERGRCVEERVRNVKAFWNGGELDPESNVAFGEGGAGTFSDGKLTTRINDPRCRAVLETFAALGAPKEILKNAKPHVGTDRLQEVVRNMRKEIIALGGEVRFGTKLTDIRVGADGHLRAIRLNEDWYDTSIAVLAIGNGARDTYEMLLQKPLCPQVKPFAVGFRAEHPQEAWNKKSYGAYYGAPQLEAADYTFSYVTDKARGEAVYSFCMCPGGTVVNASSLPGHLVTNGMSAYARDGKNANAAILASVRPNTVREALDLQQTIERAAYRVGNGLAPVTAAKDFLDQTVPSKIVGITPSFLPGTVPYDINRLFPAPIAARLREGFARFCKAIPGDEPTVLTAPETRTSAPLRILRNETTLTAIGCDGLYPCGEGAGYAGGIMSSAVDGLRVAEQIIRSLQ